MADKGGLIGIFLYGATLAIVSFSCTGPLIGSALVEASSKGFMAPLVVHVLVSRLRLAVTVRTFRSISIMAQFTSKIRWMDE
jgi:thiol:disulfide interchange protein DsbD